MKTEIQKLIERSINKIAEKDELRRLTILNILHVNIDRLIENSIKWFQKDIPAEYEAVIRSLMTLSMSSLVAEHDWMDRIADEDSVDLDLREFFSLLQNEIDGLFPKSKLKIVLKQDEDYQVHIQAFQFKEALYNILLSMYFYMEESSVCVIDLERNQSNVIIHMKFEKLNYFFPGIEKIQKAMFSHMEGVEFKVGVGISTSLSTVRRLGGQFKFINHPDPQTLCLDILLPTTEFYNTIQEIRTTKTKEKEEETSYSGDLLLLLDDKTLNMFLNELLIENGYTIVKSDEVNLEKKKETECCKAIITDFEYIEKHFINCKIFESYVKYFSRVIIIHGSDSDELDTLRNNDKYILYKKPVELEEIISAIEKPNG